jgi:hypothetical protein
MMRRIVSGSGIVLSLVIIAACSSAERRSAFGTDTDGGTPAGGDGGAESNGFGGGPSVVPCGLDTSTLDPEKDYDGDGYKQKDDCNECDVKVNRGAFDVPGNGVDDDCNGKVDDAVGDSSGQCDDNLPLDATDPFDGAKAIGLCKKASATGRDWGVLEAEWVQPDGTPLPSKSQIGTGILTAFGVNTPQAGTSVLALSSGTARAPSDPGYSGANSRGTSHNAPPGYPKESPACAGVTTGEPHDGAALRLKIRVPSNANSFSYQQNFFTQEYPVYICNRFNDFFVTMMDPAPPGLPDGNIAFDQDGNPISVNNSLLQVCDPALYKDNKKQFLCPLGDSALEGTGFNPKLPADGDGAATGWLTTSTPVTPGSEITLTFAIWDSGDSRFDSTVLLDDFKFSVDGASTQTKPSDPK